MNDYFAGIEFRDSRSLKVLPKVKRERAIADRVERILTRPTPRYKYNLTLDVADVIYG